ncbi:MAG: acyl--CoA ligase [Bacteroidales bacterium]|nr:acyl--CoA ligase [Bacteroidales bacterium]
MDNYFYSLLPEEEMSQLSYIPTVPEFLTWIGSKWGDKPAISDTNVTYSYSQMCERIACRRAFLADLNLNRGDKVAIWERSSIDAVEMFLAVLSSGLVGIMLPTQLSPQVVAGSCLKFDVSALAVRDEFRSSVEGVLPQNVKIISSAAMAEEGIPVAEVDKDDPAAIFFTGGTTGTPKGVVLPHRAIMRGAFNGVFAPGPQLGFHRQVGLLPLSHVFGMIKGTLSALYTGSLWFSAEDMKGTITKLPMIKPTMLVLVPGLCEILMGLAKMYGPGFFGGELKTIISGAANVPPLLIKEFEKLGISLLAGYGMTEGANLTSGNADVVDRPTSVGKIYPEQEVKIVDGEIWFRGDNVFLGYYGEPEETAKVLTEDGWLRTGDLGRFDEDGYLYITGRIKNLIILSNGENVSPESIEEPFYACYEIKDCLVREEEGVIAIEILPRMEMFDSLEWTEIEAFFKKKVQEINETLPSTHRVSKVVVRKEDFKRSGAMKVLRNQK